MANTRIKDISTAATTLNSDDFIAVDGATSGTRKMAKADLITEVSTGVSGTYLEESNNLSDVASKDTSKLNLEVPDVGSSPQEVSLNGMLGSMAFQSAEAVSAGNVSAETLEVESTTGTATTQALTVTDGTDTNFVVQEDGQTVVGGTVSSVAKFGSSAKGLTVRSDTSSVLALNDTDNANYVGYFAQNGTNTYLANYTAGNLYLGTNATTRVTIDSSGDIDVNTGDITQRESSTIYNKLDTDSSGLNITVNAGQANVTRDLIFKSSVSGGGVAERLRITSSALVLGSGMAIDFGSAATSAGQGAGTTGSVSNSVLSDYEFGSWVPRFEMTGANFAALTMDVIAAQYCKVGRHVHCQAYIRTDNVDTTGASGTVAVQGLPFVSDASSGNHTPLSVGYSAAWVNAPTAGYVQPNATYVYLTRNGTTGTSVIGASDVTNGASADKNELIFSVSYIAST